MKNEEKRDEKNLFFKLSVFTVVLDRCRFSRVLLFWGGFPYFPFVGLDLRRQDSVQLDSTDRDDPGRKCPDRQAGLETGLVVPGNTGWCVSNLHRFRVSFNEGSKPSPPVNKRPF